MGMCSTPMGYGSVDGTSFASPMVAGGAAVVKAARPGLLAAQYRSLLINTAAPAFSVPGVPALIQEAGAGQLDLSAALTATSTVTPASLAFGIGAADAQVTRSLTLANVGSTRETFLLSVDRTEGIPGFVAPGSRTAEAIALSLPTPGRRPVLTLSTASMTLDPGASAPVAVTFGGTGLGTGAHEGFLHITGTNSGLETRVPYWYGVPSGTSREYYCAGQLERPTRRKLRPGSHPIPGDRRRRNHRPHHASRQGDLGRRLSDGRRFAKLGLSRRLRHFRAPGDHARRQRIPDYRRQPDQRRNSYFPIVRLGL